MSVAKETEETFYKMIRHSLEKDYEKWKTYESRSEAGIYWSYLSPKYGSKDVRFRLPEGSFTKVDVWIGGHRKTTLRLWPWNKCFWLMIRLRRWHHQKSVREFNAELEAAIKSVSHEEIPLDGARKTEGDGGGAREDQPSGPRKARM